MGEGVACNLASIDYCVVQKPNFRPHSYLRDAIVGVKATDCSNIIARKGNGTGQHRPYSPEVITLEQLVQITVQGLGQHACLLCPIYIVHQLLAFKWSATAVTELKSCLRLEVT